MKPSDHRIDGRDWGLLGILSVLWGGSFFFNGVALKELPPLTLVFLRVVLAALILLPVRAYRAFPAIADAGRDHMAGDGRACGIVDRARLYRVLQILRRSGSSNVMLVTLLIPVTALLPGYLVLGESVSGREIAGAVVIGRALLLIDGRVLDLVRRPLVVR